MTNVVVKGKNLRSIFTIFFIFSFFHFFHFFQFFSWIFTMFPWMVFQVNSDVTALSTFAILFSFLFFLFFSLRWIIFNKGWISAKMHLWQTLFWNYQILILFLDFNLAEFNFSPETINGSNEEEKNSQIIFIWNIY